MIEKRLGKWTNVFESIWIYAEKVNDGGYSSFEKIDREISRE